MTCPAGHVAARGVFVCFEGLFRRSVSPKSNIPAFLKPNQPKYKSNSHYDHYMNMCVCACDVKKLNVMMILVLTLYSR